MDRVSPSKAKVVSSNLATLKIRASEMAFFFCANKYNKNTI